MRIDLLFTSFPDLSFQFSLYKKISIATYVIFMARNFRGPKTFKIEV